MVLDPWWPKKCIALDTNLLVVLIAYSSLAAKTVQRDRILGDIRGRNDGLSPKAFDILWQLVRNVERRLTTQHVVAESYNILKRQASLPHREDLWNSAIAFLADRNVVIEEHSCRFQDLRESRYSKILNEVGPCDAGLICTAERQGATIVSDDSGLIRWAGTRAVPAITLKEIASQ